MREPFRGNTAGSGYDWSARKRAGVPVRDDRAPQRLLLSGAGLLVLGGLAAFAMTYGAPLADPPQYATASLSPASASTAVTDPAAAPSVAAPEVAASEDAADVVDVEEIAATDPDAAGASDAIDPAALAAITDAKTSSQTATTSEAIAVPAADDPRWAPGVKPGSRTMLTTAEASATLQAFASEREEAIADRDASGSDPDLTRTAALAPQEALVEAARKSAPEARAPEASAPAVRSDGEATRSAVTSSAVTMRARPTKGGSPLGTIPAGAKISLVGCDGWCEVVYSGKRGYIYKSFVKGGGAGAPSRNVSSARASKAVKPAAEAPRKTVDLNRVGR